MTFAYRKMTIMQILNPRARALPENIHNGMSQKQSTLCNPQYFFYEISEKNYFVINKKALLEISCTHNYTRTGSAIRVARPKLSQN